LLLSLVWLILYVLKSSCISVLSACNMMPFDKLVDLFRIVTDSRSRGDWVAGKPPTEGSIERIQKELRIRIPEDYMRLASACPSYAVLLASIGDDFDNGYHILYLNRGFHDGAISKPPLAQHFVLLDHGHDGDCDCWDTREMAPSGEHPIIYVGLEGERPCRVGRFNSFREYIENFVILNAPRIPKKSLRRKAKRIIQEFKGNV
jgi:hypothetical protein